MTDISAKFVAEISALKTAIERLCSEAETARDAGFNDGIETAARHVEKYCHPDLATDLRAFKKQDAA